jgi:hypothetical protein
MIAAAEAIGLVELGLTAASDCAFNVKKDGFATP